MKKRELLNVLVHFKVETIEDVEFQSITHGYINDTFSVSISGHSKFILQRINKNVFKNYNTLQHNIDLAITSLKNKAYAEIEFIKTKKDSSLAEINGDIWRLMTYINESQTFNTTKKPKVALEAGRIIGTFHNLLTSETLDNYKDVINDFHNLPSRRIEFLETLENADDLDKTRAKNQIEFALKTLPKFDSFYNAELPVRLCHNDTKLNNILFNHNDEALCLIDLDTIMKGYFHYDFGDAIRTIVNAALEDEKELSKINFSDTQFNNFVNGLYQSKLKLSDVELAFLPISAALMPFIHGIRALTDYLNKNKYYKVSYPEQNLDRCSSLFQFSILALDKQDFMKRCISIIYK